MNVISDIAGRYDELMLLLEKMPKDEVLSVGDLVDRGPKSKEVVEWFMKNGKAILGNHEQMMIDHYRKSGLYEEGIWLWNGGSKTLDSYKWFIPEEVIIWMESLPLYKEIDNCLISHSFIRPGFSLEQACMNLNSDPSIIWNRYEPQRIDKYKFQISGHNSQFKLRKFSDEKGEFAICLDDSGHKKLTGIHLPTMQIYQQEYLSK